MALLDVKNLQKVYTTHFGAQKVQALSDVNSPKVLMGDFNLLPESPILDQIRILMADTADIFDKPKLSYPSDNPVRKIDYIFVSDDIKVLEADIPAVIASDHRPHTALIDL
ncbi:hypothetical protein EOM86_10145 [Candidatus Nomurabacteria bacterium]|nr:hypothetical protein [Candidatus Nomurabacteria bacterium]